MDLEGNEISSNNKRKDEEKAEGNSLNEERSEDESEKLCFKQMTPDDVLLSSILNLPLEKVISIL